MNQDQKFQQRWEFRRRDDEFDSSSDDAKSSSSGEPAYKKHKLVSNFILPEFDENGEEPGSQQNDKLEPNNQGHLEFGKANKMQIGSSKKRNSTKKKKSSSKDKSKRKNKRIVHKAAVSLDDFKIFMKSILEELKVARENMFTCMREEMKKLGTVETAPRPTRKKGSRCAPKVAQDHHNGIEMGTETQNRNTGSLKRSLKSNGIADSNNRYEVHEELAQKVVHENHSGIETGMETQICNSDSLKRSLKSNRTDTNNCYEVLDEQVNNEQDIGSNVSNEKDKGERLRFSVRKPKYSSNPPDQVVSSAYLTLPTVLSKVQVDNHRLDSSSCNYIQRGATGNNTNVNLERANLMIDSSSQHGYFSSIQQEEQFGSSALLGSHNMGFINQRSTQTSSMATGFPVPLHKDLHNGFNIPSQVLLENSSRDNNILGTRMNRGAIRFSGGSYVLSEHFIPNNFHSHTNNKN